MSEQDKSGEDALSRVEAERDEAYEHIAKWLNDNPPLSTADRVESGLTGDLALDMMRYATRLKDRVEKAEVERAKEIEALRQIQQEYQNSIQQARAEADAAWVAKIEALIVEWEQDWEDAVDRGQSDIGLAARKGAARRLRALIPADSNKKR